MADTNMGDGVENPYAAYEAEAATLEDVDLSFWKPQPGDSITGKVVYLGEQANSKFDVRIIKIQDWRRKIHARALTTALERQIVENSIVVGDVISIRYLGEQPSRKGTPFKRFVLKVHEKSAEAPPF